MEVFIIIVEHCFTGRQAELSHLQAWFNHTTSKTKIIVITGRSGNGKSTLLRKMLRLAAAQGAATLGLDGRCSTNLPVTFYPHLLNLFSEGGRFVLGIDDWDTMGYPQNWLASDLLPLLPKENYLVLLTSQEDLPPYLSQGITCLPLAPFTKEEAREYLNKLALVGTSPPLDGAATDNIILTAATGVHLLREAPPSSLYSVLETMTASFLHATAWGPEKIGKSVPALPALVTQVREALINLEFPDRLETNPLTHLLGTSGPDLAPRILRMINVDKPLTTLGFDHQIILQNFLENQGKYPDIAAAKLHISRSTYYRRLRSALVALTKALISQSKRHTGDR